MSQQIEIDLSKYLRGDRILWALAGILVLWGAFTSIYTVETESQGVVLRFGDFTETTKPGLHFKLPFGIDQVYVLPVERQLKQEFGFATEGATNISQYSEYPEERQFERSMVTGDLNTAVVEWIVQYRITDAEKFLFKVLDPEDTLRDMSEAVMRTVVGDRTVDEVITIGRQEISDQALTGLRDLVKTYQLGISITQVQLKNVNPPPPVQASFNEVNQAEQERERMINEANGEYNKEVPRARGVADQKIQAAAGYALKRVNEAHGDVALFKAMLKEYSKSPKITRQRMYLETMQEVVPALGRKIILDQDASQILPMLQLRTGQEGGRGR
ncbi:MAG: FtsH protease activity modulator HflK [Opitutae bacterium]|nr:FtsH protease activity modulator HflK [Opitutae bacterium]